MSQVIFPGSFDPPTFGHLNLIERASALFDDLTVVVAENRGKKRLFTAEERIGMLNELIRPWRNVSVDRCDTLIVDYMKKRGIRLLLRGVRGMGDFPYEFELSMMNKALAPAIETVFMTADPRYSVIRSSFIKELAAFQGDIASMVPPLVMEALKAALSDVSRRNSGS